MVDGGIGTGAVGRSAVDVLLVDDDEGVHFLVARHLRRSDVTLHWSADARSAHDFLRTHEARLILLDQQLPDGRGDELLERWVAEGLIGSAEVLLCTAERPAPPVCVRVAALGATLLDKSDILSREGVSARLEAVRADE